MTPKDYPPSVGGSNKGFKAGDTMQLEFPGHRGPSAHNLGLSQKKKGMQWEGGAEIPLLLGHVAPGASEEGRSRAS